MQSSNHIDVKTVGEAVRLLKKYKGKAKPIAGGTDLLGVLKDRILPEYPEAIINLKTIQGLDYIKEDAKGLKVGALTRLSDIVKSPVVKEKYKVLGEAILEIATPQIRNMGTIGGNLCQDVRCWYYRYPHQIGGRLLCYLKGDKGCYALTGENQYHSIFGAFGVANTPCSLNCPGASDIPSYLSKIRDCDLHGAARILLATNPMPSITGRVCPHSCEQECYRGEFDESVSIRAIERFMGDYILERANEIIKPTKTDTNKRVAIIGSGPAGLSAAYYLGISGHRVTVFERMEETGGMLRYGIPEYRLPKEILRKVIGYIQKLGVEIRTGVQAGKDLSIAEIKKDYDAVFIATGAHGRVRIGVEGEDIPGVLDGINFLRAVNLGEKIRVGKKVAVIGGGNTAIDCARTAKRLGGEDVSIVYRRSCAEMPASSEEIAAAEEEGVDIDYLASPIRFLSERGRLSGIECIRIELGEPDASQRPQPVPIRGSEFTVPVDTVIVALGQVPVTEFVREFGVSLTEGGTIEAEPEKSATNIEGVFAGGEVTSCPSTVIEAIAAGRRGAVAIDLYLRGAEAQAKAEEEKTVKPFLKFNSEYLKRTNRVKISKLPLSERSIDVEDILGLSLKEIEIEANRCFNCGCVAVSSSDIATVLLALNAKIKIAGSRGIRIIPIAEFYGSLGNGLEADEIVTEIQIPKPLSKARQTFLKFTIRKPVDFAIVSLASVIHVEGGVCKAASISLGAVAPIPIRAMEAEQAIKGRVINALTAGEAAEAVVADARPLRMNAYKVEITKTLVKRAILS
jgi:NADPH-dependent glutamate synthase beta subunit-like oxidoreductase/CO/xanthine dehydrogenase FAD-binding subunit